MFLVFLVKILLRENQNGDGHYGKILKHVHEALARKFNFLFQSPWYGKTIMSILVHFGISNHIPEKCVRSVTAVHIYSFKITVKSRRTLCNNHVHDVCMLANFH